jgi:hypothetical protein
MRITPIALLLLIGSSSFAQAPSPTPTPVPLVDLSGSYRMTFSVVTHPNLSGQWLTFQVEIDQDADGNVRGTMSNARYKNGAPESVTGNFSCQLRKQANNDLNCSVGGRMRLSWDPHDWQGFSFTVPSQTLNRGAGTSHIVSPGGFPAGQVHRYSFILTRV